MLYVLAVGDKVFSMRIIQFKACLLALFVSLIPVRSADLASHAFTYQGRLFDGSNPANGYYDLKFGLFDAAEAGAAVASVVATNAIAISNGLFTVSLDFGPAFDGSARWLEISERTNGVGAFITLVPRQFLATVPYASFAAKASVADSVPASGLTGPVPDDRLSTNVALLSAGAIFRGVVSATGFSGSGAGLSNVVVPDGSINLAKLGPDAQFVRAPYLEGVSSGLDKEFSMRILIDGVPSDVPAKLAQAYTEGREVIEHRIIDGHGREIVQYIPGKFTNSPIVLRRRVTSDRSWLTFHQAAADGNETILRHNVGLRLFAGREQVASWDFTDGYASSHKYRLADDDLPVEEVSFVFAAPVERTARKMEGIVPAGSGVQTGFGSGQPKPLRYHVWVGGTNWSKTCVIGSDLVNEVGQIQTKLADGSIRVLPGRRMGHPFSLRQSVSADNDLFEWYFAQASGAGVIRRDVEFRLGEMVLEQCARAYPFSYRLAVGDDGLPFEEYGLVYEGFSITP